jgi:hypothetical protein
VELVAVLRVGDWTGLMMDRKQLHPAASDPTNYISSVGGSKTKNKTRLSLSSLFSLLLFLSGLF